MNRRPIPQTPAEHHAEAVALLNDVADYSTHSSAYLASVMRASVHASLALYRPPVDVTLEVPAAEPVTPPVKAPRKAAARKSAPEGTDG